MTATVDGKRIQSLRVRRGWTQEQLAEQTGLSSRTIQRLERAESASMDTIQAIAATLDVDSADLLAEPTRTHFSAPWSRKLQITTAGFVIIILAVTVPIGPQASWIGPAVLVLAALFSVRGYSVVNGQLLVHRLGWSTRLDLASLQKIEASPQIMMGSVRLMGVGGLFAFLGTFRNELLGVYRAYATDGENAVVLTMNDATVVVTPDSPDEFIEAVLAEAKLPG
jgi:transcriptional regulator with XRE-family HTH domain